MKKTLSPYYITVPLVSPLSGETAIQYRLEIYVWDGLKTDVPALATYSKTVNNSSSSTGEHNVNISRLINDFIEFTPQDNASTALIDGNNQRWVKTQIFYQTVNESELDTPQSINLDIIVKGYTYGNEGSNQSTPANKNLISGTEFNVSRTGVFVLPIQIDETPPLVSPEIVISSVVFDSGTEWIITFTSVGSYTELVARQTSGVESDISTLSGVTSPQTITVPFVSASVDVQIKGFDNETATTIFSNTIIIST